MEVCGEKRGNQTRESIVTLTFDVPDVPTSDLLINAEPTPDQVQYLEDRIYEFNSGATGITDGEWLAIFVKDEKGRIVAGTCGNTWGGCLEIRQFWVEEARRRSRSRRRRSTPSMALRSLRSWTTTRTAIRTC
jgi:hypothetical protein